METGPTRFRNKIVFATGRIFLETALWTQITLNTILTGLKRLGNRPNTVSEQHRLRNGPNLHGKLSWKHKRVEMGESDNSIDGSWGRLVLAIFFGGPCATAQNSPRDCKGHLKGFIHTTSHIRPNAAKLAIAPRFHWQGLRPSRPLYRPASLRYSTRRRQNGSAQSVLPATLRHASVATLRPVLRCSQPCVGRKTCRPRNQSIDLARPTAWPLLFGLPGGWRSDRTRALASMPPLVGGLHGAKSFCGVCVP